LAILVGELIGVQKLIFQPDVISKRYYTHYKLLKFNFKKACPSLLESVHTHSVCRDFVSVRTKFWTRAREWENLIWGAMGNGHLQQI
jgi:hypothetical protein